MWCFRTGTSLLEDDTVASGFCWRGFRGDFVTSTLYQCALCYWGHGWQISIDADCSGFGTPCQKRPRTSPSGACSFMKGATFCRSHEAMGKICCCGPGFVLQASRLRHGKSPPACFFVVYVMAEHSGSSMNLSLIYPYLLRRGKQSNSNKAHQQQHHAEP